MEPLDQPQRLGEGSRSRRRLVCRCGNDRLREQHRRTGVRVLLRKIARGEHDKLARVLELALRHERLHSSGFDRDPAADLDSHGDRLAKPGFGLVRPTAGQREVCQATDEVLGLAQESPVRSNHVRA